MFDGQQLIKSATLIAYPVNWDQRRCWCRARFGDVEAWALVDTGASTTNLPVSLGKKLDCREVGKRTYVGAIGGERTRPVFESPRLNGVEITGANGTRLIANFGRMNSFDRDYLLLGWDFLQHFIVLANAHGTLLHLLPAKAGATRKEQPS